MSARISPRADYQRRRARDMARHRGARIEYQRVSILDGGSTPYQHPPRVAGLVVDGDHAAGVNFLALRATTLVGRLVEGDTLAEGAVASVEVRLSGKTAVVPLAAPLAAPLADGTPLTPRWAGLIVTWGEPTSYGVNLVDGERIKASDEQVAVPAIDFAHEPRAQDIVRINGVPATLVRFTPRRVEGVPVWYDLQVRT